MELKEKGAKKNSVSTAMLLLAAIVTITVMMGHYVQAHVTAARYGTVNGIVYEKNKPVAVIDNNIVCEGAIIHRVRVVKIYKDKVEFEKNGNKWTQQVKQRPNLVWPKINDR